MANRFKVMRTMQASNEEKLITNEVNRVTKRSAPTPSLLEAAKKHKIQKVISSKPVISRVDDIISGNKSKPPLKKIAPVSNVMNIQRAKAQLEELNKKRAAEQMSKTVAQTNKVGKRQAHIPEYSLNDIPDVLDVDKSKLPVNVRTRYLTMLADECCKLYLCQNDAYKRDLDEENSAMLAVNRIRKEVLERDQNNLGLLGSGESSVGSKENIEKSLIYKQIKKYILSDDELDIHGYPKESAIPGRAIRY
ncbi:hypothetical protein HHI36_020049 [Cryptolaemus montrouzieri]|uniref:RNA exonuclease 1 homolog-like domain-containing protein n=1 Tax=Cryptolaemus montrouzieri TaxID=559131 RepID=A0ABD2N9C1_9CUCU